MDHVQKELKEHRKTDPLLIRGGAIKGALMNLVITSCAVPPREIENWDGSIYKEDSGSSQSLVFTSWRMWQSEPSQCTASGDNYSRIQLFQAILDNS